MCAVLCARIPSNCPVHQITFLFSYLLLLRGVDRRSVFARSSMSLAFQQNQDPGPHLAGLACDQSTVPDLQHAVGARGHFQVVGHHQARLASGMDLLG